MNSLNIFGIPADRKTAKIILTPVGWEVTTSYGSGTSRGPQAILEASPQLDLFDIEFGDAYQAGYFLDEEDPYFIETNDRLKPLAQNVKDTCDEHGVPSADSQIHRDEINNACQEMVSRVYKKTKSVLAEGKIPALIGGDHSTPLGAIKAICEQYKGDVGVLHIDAHADLRLAYQGFQHSHASIMRNVCLLPTGPKKLVQVGIRDFCKEEYDFIKSPEGRVFTYFDQPVKARLLRGESWDLLCKEMIAALPNNVYISFDIDGLSPEFCPNTGTPVPGGLSFDQAVHLLGSLGRSGKKIVGFDLNEVASGENGSQWDGNVGARILFKMCGWAVTSNGQHKPRL